MTNATIVSGARGVTRESGVHFSKEAFSASISSTPARLSFKSLDYVVDTATSSTFVTERCRRDHP
jgi:hypothetical protein